MKLKISYQKKYKKGTKSVNKLGYQIQKLFDFCRENQITSQLPLWENPYKRPRDLTILLDEKGKEFTSRLFSEKIDFWLSSSVKKVNFLIGGAYGFSDEIYQRANEKISLSKMTFTHQMIRLFFVEQIYRASTILQGKPYHND